MVTQPELVVRLRSGDEAAFVELVDTYHTRLVRFARTFVNSHHAAEDVAQDTWMAVIRGVERFEERSSLQTWLLRICANRARSRFGAESRQVPVGAPGVRSAPIGSTQMGPGATRRSRGPMLTIGSRPRYWLLWRTPRSRSYPRCNGRS